MNALLALAASVLWGSSDFGGGLMSRRLHPSAAVLISQAIAFAGLVLLAPLLARGILAERLRPVQSMGVVAALGGVLLLSS